MSEDAVEQKIIELQARVAFQEDMLQSLNDTVAEQDKTIVLLRHAIKSWESRLEDMAGAIGAGSNNTTELPPHY